LCFLPFLARTNVRHLVDQVDFALVFFTAKGAKNSQRPQK